MFSMKNYGLQFFMKSNSIGIYFGKFLFFDYVEPFETVDEKDWRF